MCGEGVVPEDLPGTGSHLRGVSLEPWRSGAHSAPRAAPYSRSQRGGAAVPSSRVLPLRPAGLGGPGDPREGTATPPTGQCGTGGLQPLSQGGLTGMWPWLGVPAALSAGQPLSPRPGGCCWAAARRPAGPGLSRCGKSRRTRQTGPPSAPGGRRAPRVPPALPQARPAAGPGTLPRIPPGLGVPPAAGAGLAGHGVAAKGHVPPGRWLRRSGHSSRPGGGHAGGTQQGGLRSLVPSCRLAQRGGRRGQSRPPWHSLARRGLLAKSLLPLASALAPLPGARAAPPLAWWGPAAQPCPAARPRAGRRGARRGQPGPARGGGARGAQALHPQGTGQPSPGPQRGGSGAPSSRPGRGHRLRARLGCATRGSASPVARPSSPGRAGCIPLSGQTRKGLAWPPAPGTQPRHVRPGVGPCLPAGRHAAGAARHPALRSRPPTGRLLVLPQPHGR